MVMYRIVLEDLEELVFSRLFSPEWESGAETVVATAVATIADYMSDLSTWLSEYFYCKLLYQLLTRFTALYVMSLRRLPPGSFKFNYEFNAANRILDDEKQVYSFFEKRLEDLLKGGLRGELST